MYVEYLKDYQRAPIKYWIDPDNIEASAKEQILNLSNLPFIWRHVAIMPDTHTGYGMPIGGVIATKGVVIPNAVGVDIGCLDKNTEYLTESGWKYISDYAGVKIMQYDKETDTGNFVYPSNHIVKECNEFYHFKNNKGLDQVLSEEHKMLVFKGYKNRKTKSMDTYPLWMTKIATESGYYTFKSACKISNTGIPLNEDQIRLDIMICADGCIKSRRSNDHQIYLHLKKDRKIERARLLLEKLSISYKETDGVDGSTHIYFFVDKMYNKEMSKYWKASESQLKIVSEECLLWDGHSGYRSYFSSTNKESADLVQYAFSANGIRAGISKVEHEKWKIVYVVTPTKNEYVSYNGTITKIKSSDGLKYCFTVPTGYFVARRNGKIFITGNCGMRATRTSLRDISQEQIKKLFGGSKENKGGIRSCVPVGFSHHSKAQDDSQMPYNLHDMSQNPGGLPECTANYKSALKQVGTLGGGNHFIEIQKGSDGYIWFMIHSGSRNIGYKVAKRYNDLAKELNKKWHVSVPDQFDLAFLPIDSVEGQMYLKEMNYCLSFAEKNRFLMERRIRDVFCEQFDEIWFEEEYDIHHNYAAMENHFGSNVMIHRKGATRARDGEIGIIPGSQGTKSYIVRGKGNIESFMSCSHGAGRTMGRKQAKRELDYETEKKKLDDQSIVHSIRSIDSLDEASGAYKDIQTVMDNQKDLVDIVVELTPLGVIKG